MTHSVIQKHGLRVLTAGKVGKPIVLLPGWPQTAEAFLPLFPELSANYRVFALDPPGLGGSDAPPSGDYSAVSISTIIHEAIAVMVNEPVHVIGHDVGTTIGYAWAAQYPEQTLTLTIMDATLPGISRGLPFPLTSEVNKKLFQFSFNALPDLPEILVEGKESAYLNWLFDTKATHPERITEESRKIYIDAYSKPGAMSRGFEYYRGVERTSEQNLLLAGQKLQMPVLAVGGDFGVGAKIGLVAKIVADHVQEVVLEDCGHYVMEEQPEVLSNIIIKFIKGNTRD